MRTSYFPKANDSISKEIYARVKIDFTELKNKAAGASSSKLD